MIKESSKKMSKIKEKIIKVVLVVSKLFLTVIFRLGHMKISS